MEYTPIITALGRLKQGILDLFSLGVVVVFLVC